MKSFLDTEYIKFSKIKKSKKIDFYEIIQIGCINTDNNFKILKKLNIYLKPRIKKTIPTRITKLTSITQKILDRNGIDFEEGILRLNQFLRNSKVVFSNGRDDKIIKANQKLIKSKITLNDVKFYNIQPWIQKTFKSKKWVRISDFKKNLKIKDNLKSHIAINDVKVMIKTLKILHKRGNKLRLED